MSQVSSAFLYSEDIARVSDNRGAVFGLPMDNEGIYLLVCVATLFLFFVFLRFRYIAFPLVVVLSGGFSNILDRLVLGFVRDPIHIMSWYGNVADIFIGIGILWAIGKYIRK